MKDTAVLTRLQDKLPEMNKEVCEGLAVSHIPQCVEYVDTALRCAEGSFPEGLTYDGYRVCSPLEQFHFITRHQASRRKFDVSQSDLYYTRLKFSLNGAALKPRYLALPFVRRGGVIHIRGSKFIISPVITDNFFSVNDKKIFIPLTRARTTINRIPCIYRENGKLQSVDVHTSYMYNGSKAGERPTLEPCLVNYIFCEMGVTSAFKKYLRTTVKVIAAGTPMTDTLVEQLQSKGWVICAPNTFKFVKGEVTNNVLLAIKETDLNGTVRSVIGSFFYMLDNYNEHFITADAVDDPLVWKRTLIRFLWKKDIIKEMQHLDQLDRHLSSLSHYLDALVQRKLIHENIHVKTINEFFMYLIRNFFNITHNADTASVEGKVLQIVPEVLHGVVTMLFRLTFDLYKLSGPRLNVNMVNSTFDRKFKPNEITQINYNCVAVSSMESATECMPLKATGILANTQHSSKAAKTAEMQSDAHQLHPDQFAAGTYQFISKGNPTGRARINPWIQLGPSNEVQIRDEWKPLVQNLRDLMNQ